MLFADCSGATTPCRHGIFSTMFGYHVGSCPGASMQTLNPPLTPFEEATYALIVGFMPPDQPGWADIGLDYWLRVTAEDRRWSFGFQGWAPVDERMGPPWCLSSVELGG